MCEALQKKVEGCFGRVFQKIGHLIARKGWLVMLITSLILLPLAIGWIKVREFQVQQIAWSPENNRAIQDQSRKNNFDLYEPQLITYIYKAKNDENVVTIPHIRKVLEFHKHLLQYQNNSLSNNCVKDGRRCLYTAHPAQYFEDQDGQITQPIGITTQAQLLDKINTGKNTILNTDVAVGNIFGGTTPSQLQFNSATQRYNLEQALAIKFDYLMYDDYDIAQYSRRAIEEFQNNNNYHDIQISVWSFVLFDEALNSGIFDDIIIFNISVTLLVTYSLIVLGNCHPVECRVIAPLMGILSTALSFVVSYGLCCMFSLKITSIHNLLPFLLLGIGVDDMYVITAVADQVNPKMTIEKRMGKTMKLAGVSILITSVTDCIAFLLSATSRLPALKSFCIFAGLGVLFDFIFEITLFSSVLAMDLRRQKNRKPECCGLCCCKPTSWFFCCGKCTPRDLLSQQKEQVKSQPANNNTAIANGIQIQYRQASQREIESEPNRDSYNEQQKQKTQNHQKPASDTEDLDDDTLYVRNSFIQICLSKYYSRFITHSCTMIGVFIFFTCLTAFAAFGVTQVKTDFELQFFVNSDHYLQGFITKRKAYFAESGDNARFYTDSSIDILTEQNQQKYLDTLNILGGVNSCTHCDQNWVLTGSLSSWYLSWMEYVDAGNCDSICNPSPCKSGNVVNQNFAKQCLYNFLNSNQGSNFVNNYIAYTRSGSGIQSVDATASQFTLKRAAGSEEAIKILDQTRLIADNTGPPNSFIFAQRFITWEQYKDFPRELTVSLVSALVAIFLIILIFSGSICSSLLVFLNMGLIDLNLLALIWYWNLELNFITMINLILAIGLAVDYSAHIAHAYNQSDAEVSIEPTSKFQKRKSKVRGAFKKIGSSVFHGAFSTFLAIVTISASSSYIFRAFFKQWFAIILFGMLHGFMLLPCILSLVGPLKKSDLDGPIKKKN